MKYNIGCSGVIEWLSEFGLCSWLCLIGQYPGPLLIVPMHEGSWDPVKENLLLPAGPERH